MLIGDKVLTIFRKKKKVDLGPEQDWSRNLHYTVLSDPALIEYLNQVGEMMLERYSEKESVFCFRRRPFFEFASFLPSKLFPSIRPICYELWKTFPQIKREYVDFQFSHRIKTPDVDGRGMSVSLGKLVHVDPVVRVYDLKVGRDEVYQSKQINVSMALVAEAMSTPSLVNVSEPMDTIDSKIDMFFRNMHSVNVPMHCNLANNLLIDTVLFVKNYVRYKRISAGVFSRLGNVLAPAC